MGAFSTLMRQVLTARTYKAFNAKLSMGNELAASKDMSPVLPNARTLCNASENASNMVATWRPYYNAGSRPSSTVCSHHSPAG